MAEQSVSCDPGQDHGPQSILLSPIQYDSLEAAWFVVTESCDGVETGRLYVVETRKSGSEWTMVRATPLGTFDLERQVTGLGSRLPTRRSTAVSSSDFSASTRSSSLR